MRWAVGEVAWTDDNDDRVAIVALTPVLQTARLLTGSGAAIWRIVAEGSGTLSTDEVTRAVAEQFAVEPEVVASEVASFLEGLRAEGLLVRVDEASAA